MEAENHESQNLDSDGLGYDQYDGGVLGSVDEVNGPGSRVCPGFRPTVEELRILARHWLKISYDLEINFFYTRSTGSTEYRLNEFAMRRLARIEEAIGNGEFTPIESEVCEKYRIKMGERHWEIFMHGSQDERDEIVDESMRLASQANQ